VVGELGAHDGGGFVVPDPETVVFSLDEVDTAGVYNGNRLTSVGKHGERDGEGAFDVWTETHGRDSVICENDMLSRAGQVFSMVEVGGKVFPPLWESELAIKFFHDDSFGGIFFVVGFAEQGKLFSVPPFLGGTGVGFEVL